MSFGGAPPAFTVTHGFVQRAQAMAQIRADERGFALAVAHAIEQLAHAVSCPLVHSLW